MARRPRRNHDSAFKARVAVAAIKGVRTLVELARDLDVNLLPAGVRAANSERRRLRVPLPHRNIDDPLVEPGVKVRRARR